MLFFSFNLEKPVRYFMGGEFTSTKKWIHQKRFHKENYEIIFCIKGPLYLKINEQKFTIKDNTVLIVPPYKTLEGYRASETAIDFYWLHFFPQSDTKTYDGDVLDFNDIYGNIKNHVALPNTFKICQPDQFIINLHQIISITESKCPVQKRDFLTSALLIDLYDEFSKNLLQNYDSKLTYIQEWITPNMSESLTVEDIAEHIHLNRNYLTRLFKKYLGITTKQYIIKLKLEVASLLLLRTDLPIKNIAYESFFSNPRVFMRRFKIEKGMTPSKYRKQYRNINQNNADISPFIPIPTSIANLINDGATEEIINHQ